MILFLIILELILIWPAIHNLNKWLKKKKVNKSGLIALMGVLFIFTLVPIGYYHYEKRYLNPKIRLSKFDAHQWRSSKGERYTMVKDILENELFKGKNKAEILKLLGTDYELGPCTNCIGYSTYDPDIGFSIDHDVLAFHFDSLDFVIEIRNEMW